MHSRLRLPLCFFDGLRRDLNPGPPAPKAGIIPLDHEAVAMMMWGGHHHTMDNRYLFKPFFG